MASENLVHIENVEVFRQLDIIRLTYAASATVASSTVEVTKPGRGGRIAADKIAKYEGWPCEVVTARR